MKIIQGKKRQYALLTLSALALSVSVMNTAFGGLAWVALVPAALVFFKITEENPPGKRFYAFGLVFFTVYGLSVFHFFIYMYPLEFLEISRPAALAVVFIAWIGMTLLQAVPGALIFVFWRMIGKTGLVGRHKWLLAPVAGALWTVMEWTFTLTWAGVPWSRLALGQTGVRAVIASASLFGSYFITFLIVTVNFFFAYAIFYRRRACAAVAVGLFSFNLALGGVLLAVMPEDSDRPVVAAAIQGNISTNDRWNSAMFSASLERHKRLTGRAGDAGAEIVVWAEGTVPDVLSSMPNTLEIISKCAKENDCYLLAGGFDIDEAGKKYNATYTFLPDGSLSDTRYFKRRPVPFGEYIPAYGLITDIIPVLGEINDPEYELSPGSDTAVIETEYGKLGSIICFDSIYETLILDSVRDGAELLMVSTNDSWFSDSFALSMHNAQSVLRAVENGRWVVRSANTGISSVISPSGRIVASLDANTEGILCEVVWMRDSMTLYTRIGNLFVGISGSFLVALAVAGWLENRKKNRK